MAAFQFSLILEEDKKVMEMTNEERAAFMDKRWHEQDPGNIEQVIASLTPEERKIFEENNKLLPTDTRETALEKDKKRFDLLNTKIGPARMNALAKRLEQQTLVDDDTPINPFPKWLRALIKTWASEIKGQVRWDKINKLYKIVHAEVDEDEAEEKLAEFDARLKKLISADDTSNEIKDWVVKNHICARALDVDDAAAESDADLR